MRQVVALVVTLTVLEVAGKATQSGARYGFIRPVDEPPQEGKAGDARRAGGARRVFGGAAAKLQQWSAACALLDRYWAPRCTATVVAPYWVVTAAHCVSPHLAYVKYNARHPAAAEGDVAPVLYLYRHPGFKVVVEDLGRGPDVVVLQHDVGMIRTRREMTLLNKPVMEPLHAIRTYSERDLQGSRVEVLGFGRTERSAQGEELCATKLVMVDCERLSWMNCVCGRGGEGAGQREGGRDGEARGVCVGDSGGPVLLKGALVAVTSMGPIECGSPTDGPPESATSVFTALHPYAELLNQTMHDTDASLRMQLINKAAPARTSVPVPLSICVTYFISRTRFPK